MSYFFIQPRWRLHTVPGITAFWLPRDDCLILMHGVRVFWGGFMQAHKIINLPEKLVDIFQNLFRLPETCSRLHSADEKELRLRKCRGDRAAEEAQQCDNRRIKCLVSMTQMSLKRLIESRSTHSKVPQALSVLGHCWVE